MKRVKQFHQRKDALTPEQAVQFLDDFTKLVHGQDARTKPISLRVPENILRAFKALAKARNQKYQAVIVQLMREWIASTQNQKLLSR